MNMFLAILSQALVFTPVSFGMYVSSKILKITDLAIDGSFLIGAAAFTLGALNHYHPLVSIGAAIVAGGLVGLISSFIQYKNRVQPIIAGILAVFFTHGAFFLCMKGPNVGLFGGTTFAQFQGVPLIISILSLVLVAGLVINLVLTSSTGLGLRAFGTNPQLLTQLGKKSEAFRQIGLAVANSSAALAGALTAQQNGYADISMGFGVALIGIAAILIGQHAANHITVPRNYELALHLGMCFLGTFVYFAFITSLLVSGVNPVYLKSIFALTLSIALQTTSST